MCVRTRGAFVAAATVAALAFTVATASAATTTMTFQLRGYEVRSSPATFVGFWQSTAGSGFWAATIVHEQLRTKPNQATRITRGAFFLGVPGSMTFTGPPGFTLAFGIRASDPTGSIDPGARLVARPVVARPALARHLCTQSFLANGTLNGAQGSFQGTLTHYGTRTNGACDVSLGLATFEGSVTVSVP